MIAFVRTAHQPTLLIRRGDGRHFHGRELWPLYMGAGCARRSV